MTQGREDLLRTLGYSDKAIRYITEDHNFGRLADPSIDADHVGQCGDLLHMFLKLDSEGKIAEARFEHVGCMGLQASAAGLTTMVRGLTPEEAERIDVGDLVAFLGSIPQEKMDCAELARDTLRKAIAELRGRSKSAEDGPR